MIMKHYIELTKPRITWLILMSTGVGYFFGLKRAFFNPVTGAADWALLIPRWTEPGCCGAHWTMWSSPRLATSSP